MDLYDNVQECKNAKLTWYDYEKYKAHYNVQDSWEEIEKNLINTYKAPSDFEYKYEEIDPNGNYKDMLKKIKPKFYKQTKKAVQNSLSYMYYKYGSGYYARIRNGKLETFSYIWNPHWRNSLADKLLIDPVHAYRYKHSNKEKWPVLGSMVRVYEKKYEGYGIDFYYSETKYLLQKISLNLPDCDFIIANKDNLVIKLDLSEPCEEIVGNIMEPMKGIYKYEEYCPIFSYCWNERYADIPLPAPDDIKRIYKLYPAEKCTNIYLDVPEVKWENKKATAVFRGSYTGSSANVERNPRLHVAMMNHKWEFNQKYNDENKIDGVRYLDAGISNNSSKSRGRKEINDKYIRFVDENYWKHVMVTQLNHKQQSEYKYILYIEGNAAAYRGAFLFSLNSVVLWVKPEKYHLWFEPYLKNGVNCIFIKHDLSNLDTIITWLKNNDSEAEGIAKTGRKLYDQLLTKKAIESYASQAIISSLNLK